MIVASPPVYAVELLLFKYLLAIKFFANVFVRRLMRTNDVCNVSSLATRVEGTAKQIEYHAVVLQYIVSMIFHITQSD